MTWSRVPGRDRPGGPRAVPGRRRSRPAVRVTAGAAPAARASSGERRPRALIARCSPADPASSGSRRTSRRRARRRPRRRRARPASRPAAVRARRRPVTPTARSAPSRVTGAVGHRHGDLGAHGAVRSRMTGGTPSRRALTAFGVADHAADEERRRAGVGGDGVGDEPAGARFGRRRRVKPAARHARLRAAGEGLERVVVGRRATLAAAGRVCSGSSGGANSQVPGLPLSEPPERRSR